MPNSHTGYRYYTVAQLARLNRILVLKDLGFNLDQVREILNSNVSAAELRSMLLLRRNDVEQTIAAESRRLHHIETRIAQLKTRGRPVRRRRGRPRGTDAPAPLHLDALCLRSARHVDSFWSYARTCTSSCQKGTRSADRDITHCPRFEQDEIDVEFGYLLEDGFEGGPSEDSVLTLRELESVERMAVCVRVGLPEDAHLVAAEIRSLRRGRRRQTGRAEPGGLPSAARSGSHARGCS